MALVLSGPARRVLAPYRGFQSGSMMKSTRPAMRKSTTYRSLATLTGQPGPSDKPKSGFRTVLGYAFFGLVFASLGFGVAVGPVLPNILKLVKPLTDEESLQAYNPEDDAAMEVERHINNCDLAQEMRGKPGMRESRPHMKLPEPFRRHNLTAGTLLGPGRLTVPPLAWVEEGGKSLVTIMHLGTDVCGHPGIVHGGLLATLLDEGLARCCFEALPSRVAVTAQLEVNYRKPTKSGQYVVLRAKTVRVDGRKAWVEGHIETLAPKGETPVVLAEASGLFISPKTTALRLLSHLV